MADHTHIEWTDATWNPVTGCSVVSPGCTNCYAMRLAGSRLRDHPSRAGLTTPSKAGPVWNGQVRLNTQWLDQPLRWKKPRRIFVCAHGDLFHESVPDAWIDQVFAVMALAPQHTFQVLTKRAARMREYVTAITLERIASAIPCPSNMAMSYAEIRNRLLGIGSNLYRLPEGQRPVLPLPNVWLGVSAEDQTRADERIPDLLGTPAAVRFVSLEPLIGPVDLAGLGPSPSEDENVRTDALTGGWTISRYQDEPLNGPALDWVIVGGESGPGARPMRPDWVCQIRDACDEAGVAFFFKQWGEWAPYDRSRFCAAAQDQPVQQFGKKAAGRLLDGVTHDAMPRP